MASPPYHAFVTRDYPGLTIDFEQPQLVLQDVILNVIPDVYSRDFFSLGHINFIGKDSTGPVVVSVLTTPEPDGTHKALRTTCKGYKEFFIKNDRGLVLEDSLLYALQHPEEGLSDLYLAGSGFSHEFLNVEKKHPQARTVMKLAIIYCKPGQFNGKQMFENRAEDCSTGFWNFCDLMGKKIDLAGWEGYRGDMRPPGTAWHTLWSGIEVIFHVAPILNKEEIRRLIGNDIGVIFYFDADPPVAQFDCSEIDSLGEVPQVFAVVQPSNFGELFRTSFFSKKNVLSHKPFNCPEL